MSAKKRSSRIAWSRARKKRTAAPTERLNLSASTDIGVDVATPDGTARLRVPPGTQSGQRFRLRERGARSPRDGRRGDLVIEARLMLPKVLDERSKELLREFGRINGESVREHLSGDAGHRDAEAQRFKTS